MENEALFCEDISLIPEMMEKNRAITMVIDRLSSDPSVINDISRYATYVKLGWGLSFMLTESSLGKRIEKYNNMGIGVSNGGTFLEKCYLMGKFDDALERLYHAGFTWLELSEGITNIPSRYKQAFTDFANSRGLNYVMEVGRKNRGSQLSLTETIDQIGQVMDYEPSKIIIEGRETGIGVEIYDNEGNVKWDWVQEIISNFPLEKIMFEAPQERQQVELITHLGPHINLGNISMSSLAALTSQRFGLRGDTFGIEVITEGISASPATKFVYHVIKNSISVDQSLLMTITGLERRTVQNSIKDLVEGGMVEERSDPRDMRRKIYSQKRNL